MPSYNNIYPGADYGFTPPETDLVYAGGGPVAAGAFGLTTDARTANQLKAVFEKLRTGAKVIEVQGVSAEVLESIPKQHFDEMNRLRKLAGAELTFHGPLIEPTGITKQGWSASQRIQSEDQMWSALKRSNQLEPDGNIVVTFHTTSGLPEMMERIAPKKPGEPELIREFWVTDDQGNFSTLKPKIGFMPKGEEGITEKQLREEVDRQNKEIWTKSLTGSSFHATQGKNSIDSATGELAVRKGKLSPEDREIIDKKGILEIYKKWKSKTPEDQRFIKDLFSSEPMKEFVTESINDLNYGEIYVKDAYLELQNNFRRAVEAADKSGNKEDLNLLTAYANSLEEKDKQGLTSDPIKLPEFANEVISGINLLNKVETPKLFQPLQDFALDKASETFSNLAVRSFNEFGKNSPIISVENPPAGGGLSRAKDMKQLIEMSREKFVQKAMKEKILSESEAKRQAEKLIGATWDVGHINMLKKYGYDKTQRIEESKTIAPYLKHIHLSDNFGFEHTELPMGMGEVPMKEHLEALGDKAKKAKQVIETGQWYQYFQTTPFKETLGAFGSPIYSMKMAPVWESSGVTGEYFAGRALNPEIHHSIYGAGFTPELPTELGGSVQGRSRFSGTPSD